MRTVFGIRNTAGELIAEHVRVDWPGGKKRMYWQSPGCDARDGLMGLSTPDLPLYGSEYLNGYPVGETVLVVEGEKSQEALAVWGVPAVATVTGSSSTPGEDALSPLLPFDVVLWPDHEDGEAHMTRVAATLIRLGGGARRLTWAGAREKGDDAADFIERGGARVTLDLMVLAATPWRVEPAAPSKPVRPSYSDRGDDQRVDQARSHLVEVVSARLGPHVKKDGRSLFWRCPFHSEKSPSFKVDLREPFFRCFGCGERGDVFDFLKRMEGVEFKDALRELAPPRLLGAAIPW